MHPSSSASLSKFVQTRDPTKTLLVNRVTRLLTSESLPCFQICVIYTFMVALTGCRRQLVYILLILASRDEVLSFSLYLGIVLPTRLLIRTCTRLPILLAKEIP